MKNAEAEAEDDPVCCLLAILNDMTLNDMTETGSENLPTNEDAVRIEKERVSPDCIARSKPRRRPSDRPSRKGS